MSVEGQLPRAPRRASTSRGGTSQRRHLTGGTSPMQRGGGTSGKPYPLTEDGTSRGGTSGRCYLREVLPQGGGAEGSSLRIRQALFVESELIRPPGSLPKGTCPKGGLPKGGLPKGACPKEITSRRSLKGGLVSNPEAGGL